VGFGTLALVVLVGLLGPLLATPERWRVPVVLGQLLAGVALGRTGTGTLHPDDRTFTFLADIGFALVMFVGGTHVPVRDARLRSALRIGALRAAAVGVLAVPAGFGVAAAFGTGHGLLYAVLLASSSAALVLPIAQSGGSSGTDVLQLLAQGAVADAAAIVALPLAIDRAHAGRAGLGALAVLACAGVLFVVLRQLEQSGLRKRMHRLSERRRFALELRINLLILFALAALAVRTHVSIMLAGFSFGLAVAAVGEPRRLARQLFAVTEGFLAPLFFVWLGAVLDLRSLGRHPSSIGLGAALGLGAVAVHALMRFSSQRLAAGTLAAAQLGLPVAAATLGTQLGVLHRGEAGAIMLGAMLTIAAATVAGGRLAGDAAGPDAAEKGGSTAPS